MFKVNNKNTRTTSLTDTDSMKINNLLAMLLGLAETISILNLKFLRTKNFGTEQSGWFSHNLQSYRKFIKTREL